MKLIISSDHAGFKLKEILKKFLKNNNLDYEDLGPNKFKKDDDYPDYIIPAAKKVVRNKTKGIIIGHSGQGEAIAANRVKGIRATVFYGGKKEILTLSRKHNDSNILSLGAHFLSPSKAKEAVKIWLKTPFSKATRHKRRIKKLK
ncbi:MAG: ribose-5-phosphate isomerase [Nanoarchaeota archaeon]|nr:ribose-5-phosphate isomerase [Nanoarchaeota archaeon]|tara:strand:- start:414 stop:848 length:435 start_codon:yes stop_codon:yes gene_type:complete